MSRRKGPLIHKSMTGRVVDYATNTGKGNTHFPAEFPEVGRVMVIITGGLSRFAHRLKIGEQITITSEGRDFHIQSRGRVYVTKYITTEKGLDRIRSEGL